MGPPTRVLYIYVYTMCKADYHKHAKKMQSYQQLLVHTGQVILPGTRDLQNGGN